MNSDASELRTVPEAPTVWFTGLSGAGKTTIARAVAARLTERGMAHTRTSQESRPATSRPSILTSRSTRR